MPVHRQYSLDLGFIEYPLIEAVANGREPQGSSNVELEVSDSMAESEEGLDRRKHSMDGRRSQRLCGQMIRMLLNLTESDLGKRDADKLKEPIRIRAVGTLGTRGRG